MQFFLIIIMLFVAITVYGVLANRRREQAMAALATQRGWTALGNQASTLRLYLPQYLQGLGQNGLTFSSSTTNTTESYDMAYEATVGNTKVVFFQYQYTEYFSGYDASTHQQQETSQTHYFIVLNTTLSRSLPTILLLHHSFISKLTSFGQHSGLQPIALEGDFNKHFDTYITPNSQAEALSLLTPDTMELVIAAASNASVQFSGESMTLSFENKILKAAVIEPVLTQTEKLITNILGKAQSRLQAQAQQPTTPPSATAN
jgi:hypothetical protein